MTGARSRTVQRPLSALAVALFMVVAGCDSAVVPPSTGPGPVAPNSGDPSASGAPSGVPGVPSDGPFASQAPSPDIGLPQPATLAMPGFAAYEQVQMIGNEFAATVYTPLSCDALAGWLQAADWRIDGSSSRPLPSSAPAAGDVVPPRTRWLAISRPGEMAVAKLVSDGNDTGCRASVSRLSQQPLSASGTFATTTTALAYQMICLPDTLSVTAAAVYLGDDGTRAMISAEIPLVLGEQQLLDGEMRIGAIDFTLADLTESLAASLDTSAFMDGLELYEGVYQVSTGTATVTSIVPFVATITLGGFVSEAGATQSVSTGIRCDLPGHQLERAAIAPPVTPAPTVAPAGSMSLTIGSSISENLAGPAISCSVYGIMGADTWDLIYNSDPDVLFIYLLISPEDGTFLTYTDFRTEIPTSVQIDEARTGGHLDATVSDRGSEVDFTATGVTDDGEEVALSATCAAIERA